MNFYEELGVEPSASQEEIRQAYRSLARLLHPDQQQDEDLRRLAECQMKRLNGLHAVLTDPEQRRAYDREFLTPGLQELALVVASPPPPAPERLVSPAWIWALAMALGILGLLTYFGAEQARLQAGSDPEPALMEADTQPEPIPAAKRSAARRAAARAYAGRWQYSPPAEPLPASLYPPQAIEAVIEEQDGVLWGRYEAQHAAPDGAATPRVQFRFQGPAAGAPVRTRWIAADGAAGELELRLLSASSMEVNWTAFRAGSQALSSGNAVLRRR